MLIIKNEMLYKTLLYLSFSLLMLFASCSTSSRYTRDYTKNQTNTSKKKRSSSSRSDYAKLPKKKKSKSSPTRKAEKIGLAESQKRSSIIYHASQLKGIPYVYGGKTTNGFDCSGFISYVYSKNGINMAGNSMTQSSYGHRKSIRNAITGDLIFFGKNGKVSHVAIVVANEKNKLEVIHATSSRGVVKENIAQSVYWQKKILFASDVFQQSSSAD